MARKKSATQVTEKEDESKPQPESDKVSKSESTNPLTTASLETELITLKHMVLEQDKKIADLETAIARKRKPASNGKIQIRDKQTGKVYPSKNNVYQSLLKAGELKDLVDKGVFGNVPEKNSFGCYVLFRQFPGRFEEVKPEATQS